MPDSTICHLALVLHSIQLSSRDPRNPGNLTTYFNIIDINSLSKITIVQRAFHHLLPVAPRNYLGLYEDRAVIDLYVRCTEDNCKIQLLKCPGH
ncbi:uncharacterized protein LAJ45_05548 [Morchella importuna]|uniref:uncharacterized protein n=1 Tax=Morchella importuna TaxID=1174673 RepID=UPI001E8EB309|nr:uncharacterized protein LAJ45_05548 [Morchella importuna]KAH8150337.1 hypothetical protein LAJ45_05548 [Morchella importuna]